MFFTTWVHLSLFLLVSRVDLSYHKIIKSYIFLTITYKQSAGCMKRRRFCCWVTSDRSRVSSLVCPSWASVVYSHPSTPFLCIFWKPQLSLPLLNSQVIAAVWLLLLSACRFLYYLHCNWTNGGITDYIHITVSQISKHCWNFWPAMWLLNGTLSVEYFISINQISIKSSSLERRLLRYLIWFC